MAQHKPSEDLLSVTGGEKTVLQPTVLVQLVSADSAFGLIKAPKAERMGSRERRGHSAEAIPTCVCVCSRCRWSRAAPS